MSGAVVKAFQSTSGRPWTESHRHNGGTSIASTGMASSSSEGSLSGEPIKAILFDIDGTLADSWRLGYDATVVVLERNNIPSISEETYHAGTRYSTPERLARHAGLEPGHPDFELVGAALGQEFDDLYVGLVSLETARFYPGVLPLLQRIPRHIQLGALTNAAVRYAEAVLQCNCPVQSAGAAAPAPAADDPRAVYSRFGSIHGADTVPLPKPAPDGLWTLCRDLGLEPTHCIYVGDSPTDGLAARAAGLAAAVGVGWGSHRLDAATAPFDHVCGSVEELEELILRLVSPVGVA